MDTVVEVLKAAARLQLKDVVRHLSEGLLELPLTDVLTVLETARSQGSQDLVEWALEVSQRGFVVLLLLLLLLLLL